ncbi:MAG: RDD family protein [Neisseria sp.]|nr:RDD family protein [Neisseria sp.]
MKPAPLKRRLPALAYEALLTAAVTCAAFIPAGLAAMFLNRHAPALAAPAVSIILIAVWWFYFKTCWQKRGATLPMQTWKIGLETVHGHTPPLNRLRLRFVWTCILLVFIPLMAYAALHNGAGIPPKAAAGAALSWWILPWGFALFNRDRQFLYDFLAGTRLVDLRPSEK